jgi:hypothetical protein
MWATDYPHPDHPHTWVDDLTAYAKKLSPDVRAKVLGDNVRRIYGIDYRRDAARPRRPRRATQSKTQAKKQTTRPTKPAASTRTRLRKAPRRSR